MNDLFLLSLELLILVLSLLSAFALGYSVGYRYGFKDGARRSISFYRLKAIERLGRHGEN